MYVDACISASIILPIIPKGKIYQDYSLIIDKGIIKDILPQQNAKSTYQAKEYIDLNHHILLPGLINAHTHAAMNLFRGIADDLPLMDWLKNHIWPRENKFGKEEFVKTGSKLAIAEMLRGGTTCFNDMYLFPEVTAKAAIEAGIRVHTGGHIFDFPCTWGNGPYDYFKKSEKFILDFKNEKLITCNINPHAPYTVSDENLKQTRKFADKYDCKINIHLHETRNEITQSLNKYKIRPIARLNNLGFLAEDVIAIHMVHLDEEDFEIIENSRPQIVTCPESNLKLASGFCPVHKLQTENHNVALGTDGAASNNDLDLFGEMRIAAMLAKAIANDPTACNSFTTLEMATINGAKALGVADKIGSLEKGKQADLIAVSVNQIEANPFYHPESHLVYTASREQVTDVWVAGNRLLENRKLTTIDTESILTEVKQWQQRLVM